MRIGFLSYCDPDADGAGGGELCSRELLVCGKARGHDIAVVALWPHPVVPRLDVAGIDDWVLVDMYNLPRRQARLDQKLLGRLPFTAQRRYQELRRCALERRYVHVDNAYVDTCDRPYLACGGHMAFTRCPFPGRSRCFRLRTRGIYERALACFFVSPMHAEIVQRLQPGARGKARLLRPTLDPEPFLRQRRSVAEREIEWLAAGAMTTAKGADLLDVGPGLTLVSQRPGQTCPAGSRVVLGVPHEEMPAYFGSAKRFVFRPRWPEPFGRTAAEAALSGCELHLDGRVGALSYEVDLSTSGLYEGAAAEFWEQVEGILGGAT